MRNVYLVGFMGVGKTTVGRALAERLGGGFSDLDDEITRVTGRTPAEHLREAPEAEFRDAEADALRGLSGAERGQVVACGGGAVLRDENLATMRATGILVWLRCPLVTCLERAAGGPDRPLLDGSSAAEAAGLYESRVGRYELADVHVETAGLTVAEVVGRVIAGIEAHGGL